MNLGMAVMTGGDAVICTGLNDLIEFLAAVSVSFFRQSGLEKSPTAAAAEIIGAVGSHINEIFFPDHCFDHEAQVFRDGVPQAFPNQLARVLNRKFHFAIPVPV